MTLHARILLVIAITALLVVMCLLLRKSASATAQLIARLSGVTLFAIVIVFGIIRPYVIEEYIIPSKSMVPTLLVNDHIFVNKFIYKLRKPKYGEIVVFKAPPKLKEEMGDFLIKRVIGRPGDYIFMHGGHVIRNGVPLDEPYINEPMEGFITPITVPAGKLFVMGDNRNDSSDSRDWGPLDEEQVVGRATVRFAPLNRIGYIR